MWRVQFMEIGCQVVCKWNKVGNRCTRWTWAVSFRPLGIYPPVFIEQGGSVGPEDDLDDLEKRTREEMYVTKHWDSFVQQLFAVERQ